VSPTNKIRIVVVDDQFIVRTGLLSLLHTEPNLVVVGEAADGEEGIKLFELHRPDLMLIDLRMPGKSGHEVSRHIRQLSPEARILMLSGYEGDADIQAALEAGVRGYVFKSATGEELIPAIQAVAAGRRWIPQNVAARLKLGNTYEPLTAREQEVLGQLASGHGQQGDRRHPWHQRAHHQGSLEEHPRQAAGGGPHAGGHRRGAARVDPLLNAARRRGGVPIVLVLSAWSMQSTEGE